MKVELISGSPDPEELVCTAARNDYRNDGVIGHDFEELMEGIEADPGVIEDILDATPGFNEEAFRSRGDVSDGDPLGKRWLELFGGTGRRREVEARKRTLLDHLMDHGHWGPFEHPQATVAIEGVTRVVTHQIVRHRHFTYDQQSFRYVELDEVGTDNLEDVFQFPEFRGEDFDVDREGVHEIDTEYAEKHYRGGYDWSLHHYRQLRNHGVPKEQARKVLPMGIKTNIVMSGNARAWMHILNVRTKANVQGETRRCAEAIFEELKGWMPYTFEKYDEDILPMELNP